MNTVRINRAPVMTLWAAVVAERLGHPHAEALTLGRAVAGLNAHAKAKAIGLVKSSEAEPPKAPSRPAGTPKAVDLLGRRVPVVMSDGHLRALSKGVPIDPSSVERYLAARFKDALPAVVDAMQRLAASRPPKTLAGEAYALYEQFRPEIAPGEAGWGQVGTLSLKKIDALARSRVS